jgi:hypothetical protein
VRTDSGFWGNRGAGCIIRARDTGRMLVGLRSEEVDEPLTLGTWGGAVDPGGTRAMLGNVRGSLDTHWKVAGNVAFRPGGGDIRKA